MTLTVSVSCTTNESKRVRHELTLADRLRRFDSAAGDVWDTTMTQHESRQVKNEERRWGCGESEWTRKHSQSSLLRYSSNMETFSQHPLLLLLFLSWTAQCFGKVLHFNVVKVKLYFYVIFAHLTFLLKHFRYIPTYCVWTSVNG